MERPISFFVMLFILLFAGLGFIFVVCDLYGFSFIFELGLLLAFMFVLAFAMFLIYQDKQKSWGIIAAVMLLLLFDVFIIFLITRKFTLAYATATIFAIAGLIVALLNAIMLQKERKEVVEEPQYGKSKYYYPFIEKEEVKQEIKKEQNVVSTFTQGKFVASKSGSKFHLPKCVWANNINKVNQVWFDSKADAEIKGYSEHKCDIVNVNLK